MWKRLSASCTESSMHPSARKSMGKRALTRVRTGMSAATSLCLSIIEEIAAASKKELSLIPGKKATMGKIVVFPIHDSQDESTSLSVGF